MKLREDGQNREQIVRLLGRYRACGREVARLTEEIAHWKDQATRITMVLREVCAHGSGGDRIQLAVERMEALGDKLAHQAVDCVSIREQIGASIERLDDARWRQVLLLRYVDGLTTEQIAERMDYSVRQTINIHEQALEKIQLL